MHKRRSIATVASALALASTLSACGFDPATNRVYTPAAGPIDRDETVDVLSAVIVSAAPGAGTFIAGLSNNSSVEPIVFDTLRPVGDTTITFGELDPRAIPPRGFENLAANSGTNGVTVTGDFEAGDFVGVQLGFDNGETVELQIPVVTDCDEFEGFDQSELGEAAGEPYDCEPLEPVADGRYEGYEPGHGGGEEDSEEESTEGGE